ncbi:AbgT family transporter [Pseudonocardia spinosispora]|uniref:AbgT family transporter n=1 Tax=Pseudonocardia spinosispora TaxID=103441 RepID=UPI000403ACF1|nr:AbgT family transporter [Pseudonocardia spinosispora]
MTTDSAAPSRGMRLAFRGFDTIERIGNKLPHPFWLFWIFAVIVAVLSAVLKAAGVSAVNPSSGKTIEVQNLLSKDGLAQVLKGAVDAYGTFPPLATIVLIMLGIAVAEKAGLVNVLLRRMVMRVPGKYLTFALSMTAMVGHVASDAAYVALVPLGGLLFRAAGRSPVLGCIVAFVSVSAGYDASPSITAVDAILSGISTAAAHLVDPHYVVTPLANYYFSVASSVLVASVITLVVETVLGRRPDLQADEQDEVGEELRHDDITPAQQRALRITGLVALGYVAVLVLGMLPSVSPLRGAGGGIVSSPVISGIALVLGVFFALVGMVYGRLTGSLPAPKDVLDAMADGVRSLAPILVLFFAISQFLAYFKWTHLGEILAITGADLLRGAGVHSWLILLGIAVVITVMNLVLTSGSALWALAAPIFVPMLMLLGISPEATQAVYRVADSVTNCITPMSPYFVMTLGFVQQYRRSAGLGTIASFTIPIAAVVWIVWTAFALAWYLLGIPFGPGA